MTLFIFMIPNLYWFGPKPEKEKSEMDEFQQICGQTASEFIAQAVPPTENQARAELPALADHLQVPYETIEAAFNKSLKR